VVLSSPGSGSSTLLKTLANHRGEYYAVEGNVHYDSLSPDDITRHYRGDVQYCPEDDVHFPSLTVDQTISFATKTRAPRSRVAGLTRTTYRKKMAEAYTTVFGLRHALNTRVGDAMIRGISGGEKKRVSIAEMSVCRGLVNAWDKCVSYTSHVVHCALLPTIALPVAWTPLLR
jgi:ATP-binding cassette, subfamily G (WHITE), member 2, SNQ2